MKLLGYKASLTLSAIAIAGLGTTSTITTKAASLQATTGISTVFDNYYTSYTRNFKDSGQLLSNSTTVNGDSFTFIYSGGSRLYLGTLGSNSTAYDFNNFELVVGGSKTNAGLFDALRDCNTQRQDKGSFGGYFNGSIVGSFNLGEQVQGELESGDDGLFCSDSKMQEFDGIGANGLLLLSNSSGNYRCGRDIALFYR